MIGKSLRDAIDVSPKFDLPLQTDKGRAGKIIEAFFGISADTSSEPDFRAAGIELKIVPMLARRDKSLRSKERTVITMIDYNELINESWHNATVRGKLSSILMVYYLVDPILPMEEWEVIELVLWELGDGYLEQFGADWRAVFDKVGLGLAHEISEGDGRSLGAARKGGMRRQPRSPIAAKGRAWALKQGFTEGVLLEIRDGGKDWVGIDSPPATVEAEAKAVVDEFRGMSVRQVAAALGMDKLGGKDAHASVVARLLESRNFSRSALRLHGMTLKTIAASAAREVYESMSFPSFNPLTLGLERWETSDLLSQIERMLVVVMYRDSKAVKPPDYVFGDSFVWSPTPVDLRVIREEWLRNVRLINKGRYDDLPGERVSQRIHVRTKGRDSDEKVDWPTDSGERIKLPKRSFWLNEAFLEQILSENMSIAEWPPISRR